MSTFQTPLTPLGGPDNYYMYISGPDKELIEINTMGHHRFAHVHLFATDVNEAVGWYAKHLGLKPRFPQVKKPQGDSQHALRHLDQHHPVRQRVDDLLRQTRREPQPALVARRAAQGHPADEGRPIDHIAFSYRDIEPVYQRMKANGVKIVEPIAIREPYKIKSFLMEGPEKVSIEIVEAKPIPEGTWD